jgi:CRP-like cAMP-binding protein
VDKLLKAVPIFAGLDDPAVKMFVERAVKSEFAPGGVIAREGESNHCMYLIGAGSVRIVKYFGQADQAELTVLGAKEFFGEMCILEPAPRAATAQAVERSVIFEIQASSFHHLYKEMPAQYGILILNISRDLSRRLRHLDEVFAARHK